jgi:hypothetical protein
MPEGPLRKQSAVILRNGMQNTKQPASTEDMCLDTQINIAGVDAPAALPLSLCDPRYRWILERLGSQHRQFDPTGVSLSFVDSISPIDVMSLRGVGPVRAQKALASIRKSFGLPPLPSQVVQPRSCLEAARAFARDAISGLGDTTLRLAEVDGTCRAILSHADAEIRDGTFHVADLLAIDLDRLSRSATLSAEDIDRYLAARDDVFMMSAVETYTGFANPPSLTVVRVLLLLYTAITNRWCYAEWEATARVSADELTAAFDDLETYVPEPAARRLAVYRLDLAVAKRILDGETLQNVGTSLGVSRERIRQRLKRVGISLRDRQRLEVAGRSNREKQAEQTRARLTPLIERFVRGHPGCFDHEIAVLHGVSVPMVHSLIKNVACLVLRECDVDAVGRVNLPATIKARRSALSSLKLAGTYCFPVTGVEYDKLLRGGFIKGPSRMRIVQVFGTWKAACEEAGVECGFGSLQPGRNAAFTASEIIESVCAFLEDEGYQGASYQYEQWRARHNTHDDIPCFGVIRKTLGPSWKQVRYKALLALRQRWHQQPPSI